MIEDLSHHKSAEFACEEMSVYKALISPFLHNLGEIGAAYEIKDFKGTVMIKRPYQCDTAVHQLAKLQMLEFCYDFRDKYITRQNFDLCYMDTDSFYVAMSGACLNNTVKPERRQAY